MQHIEWQQTAQSLMDEEQKKDDVVRKHYSNKVFMEAEKEQRKDEESHKLLMAAWHLLTPGQTENRFHQHVYQHMD